MLMYDIVDFPSCANIHALDIFKATFATLHPQSSLPECSLIYSAANILNGTRSTIPSAGISFVSTMLANWLVSSSLTKTASQFAFSFHFTLQCLPSNYFCAEQGNLFHWKRFQRPTWSRWYSSIPTRSISIRQRHLIGPDIALERCPVGVICA